MAAEPARSSMFSSDTLEGLRAATAEAAHAANTGDARAAAALHACSASPRSGRLRRRAPPGPRAAIPIPGQMACLVPFAIESVKGVLPNPNPTPAEG